VYELLDRLHDSDLKASGRESTTHGQKQKQSSAERQQRSRHGAHVRQSAAVAKYQQQQQSVDPPGDPKVVASEWVQTLQQRQKFSAQPQPFTQRQRRNEV
jgi:hypothetical protein